LGAFKKFKNSHGAFAGAVKRMVEFENNLLKIMKTMQKYQKYFNTRQSKIKRNQYKA